MDNCSLKHTAYQPADGEWRCPVCGVDSSEFYVEESNNFDCPLLHPDDSIVCNRCDRYWTGTTIARLLRERAHRVTCPTCKGTGFVDKEKVE